MDEDEIVKFSKKTDALRRKVNSSTFIRRVQFRLTNRLTIYVDRTRFQS